MSHSYVVCSEKDQACQNGGACKIVGDNPYDNYCDCPDNTKGDRCHTVLPPKDLSVCNTNGKECLNGGVCVASTQEVDGVTKEANYCDCPLGTTGDVCHNKPPEDISVCTMDGNECLNGGKCVESTEMVDGVLVPANKCSCPLDTYGDVCHNQSQKDEQAAAAAEAAAAEQATSTQKDPPICTKDGHECQNGGFCVFHTADGKIPENYCICPDTHTGKRCHGTKPVNSGSSSSSSSSSNSNNSGSSNSSSDKAICSLGGDECKNGGTCVFDENSDPKHQCECPKLTYGHHCESMVCDEKHECKNGGVCVLASDQADGSAVNYCSCPKGFSGDKCGKVDECSLDCQHGSSCRHGESGDICDCVGNYKGDECEIPFEKCPISTHGEALECLWGGKCQKEDGGYSCDCPSGRSGDSCEAGAVSVIEDWNGPCYEDSECFNGGLCVRSHDAEESSKTGMNSKQTQCLCALGWGGANCEFPCKSLNCQHGSSCRFPTDRDEAISHGNDGESGAYCDCGTLPFKGKECEITFVECPDGLECLYGGACIGSVEDTDEDLYQCACPPGRKGNQCEFQDHEWKGDDNAYQSHVSHTSNNNNNNNKPMAGISSSQFDLDKNILFVSVFAAAFLALIPVTLFCLKRKRDKNDAVTSAVNEILDGMEETTASEATSEETNGNGNGQPHEDDLFDYDEDGVVNVNLDENEAVQLPKDKQIV